MLKSMKTGVSTSKRVYFQKFLLSLASVLAAYPCFCSFVHFFVEVPAIFIETAKRAITCSVQVTHRIKFLTKILNMSKLQNRQTRLISVYHRVPLHHSPGFIHDVPVMRRDWKHLIIFVVNRETKLMLLGYSGTIIFR